MCGFVGYWSRDRLRGVEPLLRCMGNALAHRGPDDAGVWFDVNAGIGLAHRRLSIVDLSAAGHQPMLSPGDRYVIAFNGEIYNHSLIRQELIDSGSRVAWRGGSDTETLLAAFEQWGIEPTLKRAVGMFAFALWDRENRSLYLARDRLGEKPLYYGWQQNTFLFGSELKALKQHPAFAKKISRNALSLLMRFNCIPAPHSIYEGIGKLQPGTYLVLRLAPGSAATGQSVPLDIRTYWSLHDAAISGINNPFAGTDAETIDAVDSQLNQTIAMQMTADVPSGAFLSGGIDSSTVVAIMQTQSSRPIHTFTMGFQEAGFDEAKWSAAISRHLGTEHTELYVTQQNLLDVIPRLPTLYDEPFSDSSQIPTFLVSQLARHQVTVALSGDGGDELFGGYNRHLITRRYWEKLESIPLWLRRGVSGLLGQIPAGLLNQGGLRLAGVPQTAEKVRKALDMISAPSSDEMYLRWRSHWTRPDTLVLGAQEPTTLALIRPEEFGIKDAADKMMFLDTMTYMPDDILVKLDRAAMGCSLETRVPFLDHRLVELAWRLPHGQKIRNGIGKWVLRGVLRKYVPDQLVVRPKAGFGVPLGSWLRGPLREWAEALLGEARLHSEGFFDVAMVRTAWREHLSGSYDRQYSLWDVLMFQSWLEKENAS